MTSCCCSSTVSVILQSCKDQEIFIRCWYVKPYNWKQLLFSELYIYEKLYCRALQLTVFYYVLHLLFIFLDSISWIAIQRLWWTVNEAAAVLDKLQEKDLISNEKFDAVRNLNERLFKDELYEVQGIKSLRFLIYELEWSQCIV